MESVYFGGLKGRRKREPSGCSKKVQFKTRFEEYSTKLKSLMPNEKCSAEDIFKNILPDEKLDKNLFVSIAK